MAKNIYLLCKKIFLIVLLLQSYLVIKIYNVKTDYEETIRLNNCHYLLVDVVVEYIQSVSRLRFRFR